MKIEQLRSLHEIEDLRGEYLDTAFETQELYLELKIRAARIFRIKIEQRSIGYFIVDPQQTLLEYFITRPYLTQVDQILATIIRDYAIKRALCKSFDHTLLACCVGLQTRTRAIGVLFREYEEQPLAGDYSDINVRFAEPQDEPQIAAINEEVFDHEEEIAPVISNQNMFIFERGRDIVGFGIFQRVIAGRPDFDIGMLVTQKYRKQGYGTYILRYLVDYCRKQGYRPTCGCAIENVASRRCLERAGFIARYRMLEFLFE